MIRVFRGAAVGLPFGADAVDELCTPDHREGEPEYAC